MPYTRFKIGAAAVAAALTLSLAGCGSSAESTNELTFSVDNAATSTAVADTMAAAFEAANPGVTVNVEARPQGSDGETLVKTRLNTGDLGDVVMYNSGSLLQSINPSQTLTPLDDESWVKDASDSWITAASVNDVLYGAPIGGATAGGFLYNKDIYADLGLSVPKTWDDLISNAEAIKAAGIVPIAQTYKDSWTSQFLVLGDFFNVQAADPDFADEWTAGKTSFAGTPAALAGFEHLEQIHALGLVNDDYASATFDQGQDMLASGAAAMYPQISGIVGSLVERYPDAATNIGFFPIPGDDATVNGVTIWQPSAVYVTSASSNQELAKKFVAFIASPEGCDVAVEAYGVAGVSPLSTCPPPEGAPQAVVDIQPFLDSGDVASALEFVSPVKGAALPDITVAVGSGLSSAEDGAAQYDADSAKQAKQLGLPGW